ncbi:MAG: DUF4349 domain-containing protein, partial [Amnibacterium sp.]
AVPVALSGCTGSSSGSGGGAAAGAGDSVGSGAAKSSGSAGRSTADRSVVTTGNLDLTARDPIGTAEAIATIVTGGGGRVQTLDERPKGEASADLTVRIPSAVFDSTLATIEHRATVRTVSVRSTDVTPQVTDYGVRIANLRASIARLQVLLARAADTASLVAIESSLTTRQTDLEQLLAEQKDLTDQVAYATLGITIETPPVSRPAPPSTFVTGFLAGLAALGGTAAALAVALGVILPWGVVAGLLALVTRWGVRMLRRRRTPAPGA